jgi:hypothetical protein
MAIIAESGLERKIGTMEDRKAGRIIKALMAVIDLEGCGPSLPLLYKIATFFCSADGSAPCRKPPITCNS